jgi:hypothetical protein
MVGRQRQLERRAIQLGAPERLGIGVSARVAVLDLPQGEIRVLQPLRRPRRRAARAQRLVVGRELGEQEPERPAIGDDMVGHQAQHVPARRRCSARTSGAVSRAGGSNRISGIRSQKSANGTTPVPSSAARRRR